MELQYEVSGKATQTGWDGNLLCRIDLKRVDTDERWRHHIYVRVSDPLAGLGVGDPFIVTIPDQLPRPKD